MAAAFTGIQVGAALVASRYVIDQTTPVTLAMLRYAIGLMCLAPVMFFTSRHWFARNDLIPISIIGIVQFGIVVVLLNYALYYISAARVALIFTTIPIQTMVITALIGREPLTWRKSSGVALTLVGIAVVLGEDLFAAAQNADHGLASPPSASVRFAHQLATL